MRTPRPPPPPAAFVLVSALAAVAAAGCGDGGEAAPPAPTTEVGAGPCRLLECTSRLDLLVRLPPGASARARACVDERCVDVALGPGACAADVRCEAPRADGAYVIAVPLAGRPLDGETPHVAALSLVAPEGGAPASRAVEFTFAKVEPGGPGCGACYQAALEFPAPGRPDESPGDD
jgi:hypothetical protein